MKNSHDTKYVESDGKYYHQCPHCERWNAYGVWGVAHQHLDLTYDACQCGKQYKVLRRGCDLARRE